MPIEKQIKTRIVLTHDEYSALSAKVLKAGEVVLAKVGTTEANGKVSEPIWMMKVGDGTSTVANCPWLVAPAADVYDWAKKESLEVSAVPTLPISKIDGLTEALAGKADAGHDHDDVYKKIQEAVAESGAADKTLKISQDAQGKITVTPVDIAIAQTQVDGLVDALAGKSEVGHKHVAADVTDFDSSVKAIFTSESADLVDRMETAEGEIDELQTAVTTTLPGEIAKKVDTETYTAKVAELVKADEDLDTAVKAAQKAADDAQKDIDTFMGTIESDTEAIDTLNEIIALINSEDAELSKSLLAEITALKDKFNAEGKALEAVNADTLDGKHADAFATAAQGTTADETAATIATYGDIVTRNAAEFDAAGSADDALEAAKEYTDDSIEALDLANTYAAKSHTHTVSEITDYETDVAAKIKVETDAREEAVEDLQGQIDDIKDTADAAVKSVAVDAATGLKATNVDGAVTIDFIEDVVFVLDGGTASDLSEEA